MYEEPLDRLDEELLDRLDEELLDRLDEEALDRLDEEPLDCFDEDNPASSALRSVSSRIPLNPSSATPDRAAPLASAVTGR